MQEGWKAKAEQLKSDREQLSVVAARLSLPWTQPRLILTPDEQRLRDDLVTSGEPYVVLHPFAGDPDRSLLATLGLTRLNQVINQITDQGWRVVVVGGSSLRLENRVTDLREHFESTNPSVTNLVGKPLRVQLAIASKAGRYLGSFSSFQCLAACMHTPMLILAPKHLRENMLKADHGIFWLTRNQGSPVMYFGEFSEQELNQAVYRWLTQRDDEDVNEDLATKAYDH